MAGKEEEEEEEGRGLYYTHTPSRLTCGRIDGINTTTRM